MSEPAPFPLAFPTDRPLAEPTADELARHPFVVTTMATASHRPLAGRLLDSARRHALPVAAYAVPAVHRSISPAGSSDPALTKANLISAVLERFGRPVLYVDADCVFARFPARVPQLVADGRDFAIFNWLAEEHTEAYRPVAVPVGQGAARAVEHGRYYGFSHSVDLASDSQLICSGAVQFYGTSDGARQLLAAWQAAIGEFPGTADDQCLDFAFNNRGAALAGLRTAWLGKAYMRCAWWIYERPVIDHPEMPSAGSGFAPFVARDARQRFYPGQVRPHPVEYVFPRDCLVDTRQRLLCRVAGNTLVPVKRLARDLWL